MTDELTLNLLFSATYVEMHSEAGKPPREIRIAHNQARRLLSDLYGWEEFQKLDDAIAIRRFFKRQPAAAAILFSGVALYTLYSRFMPKPNHARN